MNPMNNAAMWAGIVGFALPIVIQFIQREGWSRQVQALVAFVCVLIATVPTVYFSSDFDPGNFVKDALIVFTLAMVSYKRFWNPVGVTPTNHAEVTGQG